ncbi:MAG: DinB family protein [Halioglobus sp.]
MVVRGDKFVFAQVIKDVVDFLDLEDDSPPQLSPDQLKHRYAHVLKTAVRLVESMPDEHLDNELPDRPRSWRVLLHHVFQIPVAFLDMEDTGAELSYENMVQSPPEDMTTSAAIASFGETVSYRFEKWAIRSDGEDFSGQVPTYFGSTTRHEMLERTVWHSTQHVRQIAALLEEIGIKPDQPLTAEDLEGLPLTEKIWD